METKHTPGPWIIDAETSKRAFQLIMMDREEALLSINLWLYRKQSGKLIPDHIGEENQANARLVAAAPEMFQIISKAIDLFEQDLSADEYIREMMKMEGPAKELIYKIQGK